MSADSIPIVHPSAVGPVVDVAGRNRTRSFLAGLFIGPFYGSIFVWMAVAPLALEDTPWAFAPYFAALAFVGVLILTTPIRRAKSLADARLVYLRAGPGGVSFSCPSRPRLSSLGLSHVFRVRDLPWSSIRAWYPHVTYVNGIRSDTDLVFEVEGEKPVKVSLRWFRGRVEEITAAISAAARPADAEASAEPELELERAV